MEIEKLLDKLEPLRPKEVPHWRRVRDTADTELRSLLDQHILHTAYEVLGDFRAKLLLSLPPEMKAQGTFNLGTVVYETEKWGFGLNRIQSE